MKTVRVKSLKEPVVHVCETGTITGMCSREARWFAPNGHLPRHICHGHYSLLRKETRMIYWRYHPEES